LIPYLTYRGDASWWSNFAREVVAAALFWVAALLFVLAAVLGRGGTGGGTAGRARAGVARQLEEGWRAGVGGRARRSWWRIVAAALLVLFWVAVVMQGGWW
jgi:hypothetical protein